MSWYAFSLAGWFTGEVADGSPSATPEQPPTPNTEETPGEPRARWRQWGWAVEPYPEAAPQPVAYAFESRGWFTGEVAPGSPSSTRAKPDTLSTTTTPGEPRAKWDAGSWAVQAYAAPPLHLTKRAFQNRFPLLGDGVSRKYDAMAMFLTNDAWAASLIADTASRQALQLMVQTGLNRMTASAHVDLGMSEAANFTLLLTSPSIPSLFRLTGPERAAILSTTVQESERP